MGKVEPTEAALRDHLAVHLELIEPDLTLVRTEYPLPNSAGTRGRVDILARDSLGCFVIIELKRSNASARSALHELMKYLGLFRREKRLPATRLRCVLVSTDWDELLVPFSEQVNNSPFTLQGRKLLLAPDGIPRQTDLVAPLSDYNELIWPQDFSWLTFTTESQRETISSTLMRMLPAVGVENQVLVKTTSRRPEALQYPFGILLPFFPLGRSETCRIMTQTEYPIELLEDYQEVDLEHDPISDVREAVQSSLESVIYCLDGVGDLHNVSSENFQAETEWCDFDGVVRMGPAVDDQELLSDEDVIGALAGRHGANDIQFTAGVQPEHKMQFRTFSVSLQEKLSRYGWWNHVAPALEAAKDTPGTRISAHAFCPPTLLRRLALFLHSGDDGYLPSFHVLIASDQATITLRGRMAWDGATALENLDQVLPDLGTSRNVWRLTMDEPEIGERLIDALGFVFPVLVEVQPHGETALSETCRLLEDWVREHPSTVDALRSRLAPVVAM